jgi:hypothetical protein
MKQFQYCAPNAPSSPYYWFVGGAWLRRFDLATQTPVGQPSYLGMTSSCPTAEDGQAQGLGWDVTSDGKTLVYQQTFVSASPPGGQPPLHVQTTSQFKVVDLTTPGASPTQILLGAQSDADAFLAIAPDQQRVAVVAIDVLELQGQLPPTSLVYTGALNGGAASSYTPSAGGLPAWSADSTGFDASEAESEIPGWLSPRMDRWQVGTPTSVASIDGEHHPASLP